MYYRRCNILFDRHTKFCFRKRSEKKNWSFSFLSHYTGVYAFFFILGEIESYQYVVIISFCDFHVWLRSIIVELFCGKIIDIFSSLFFGGQNNFKDSCWGTKCMKDATAIIQKGKLKWKHDHICLLITLSYCEICYIVSLGSPKEIYAFSHLVMQI